MILDSTHRDLGPAPADLCEGLRSQLQDIDWYDDQYQRYEPTLDDGRLLEMPYALASKRYAISADSIIAHSIQRLINWINMQDGLDSFEPVRCEIAALLPDVSLGVHRDRRWMHANSRRLHIPISTNAQCWHTGGAEIDSMTSYHMVADRLYELNNIDWHQAGNDSTSVRVHLIVDFMPVGFLAKQIELGVDPRARVPALSLPVWQ